MSHLLEFQHVSYSYHSIGGETLALSDISFTMTAGEFLAIVGCRKTIYLTGAALKKIFTWAWRSRKN